MQDGIVRFAEPYGKVRLGTPVCTYGQGEERIMTYGRKGMHVRRLTRVTSGGVVLMMLFSMLASSGTSVSAASDYYADTGHYLYGQFRDYWNGNGGLFRFGYPISKVFNQKSTNSQTYPTQYLQRAVFEQHQENKGTQFEVLGRLLGVIQAGAKVQTDPNFKPVTKPTDGRLFSIRRITPSVAATPVMRRSARIGRRPGTVMSSKVSSSSAIRSRSRSTSRMRPSRREMGRCTASSISSAIGWNTIRKTRIRTGC
jgi:hypothetical protein